MNTENLIKVIKKLESTNDTHFSMNVFMNKDGLPMCIAGHAARIAEYNMELKTNTVEGINGEINYNIYYEASKWLGLTEENASYLFQGRWSSKNLFNITREETIDYLKRCIKSEKIIQTGAEQDNTW
jgi:hypothetical protein